MKPMSQQDWDVLERIVNDLQTQDNDCTEDPIYMVQQLMRIVGMDEQWADSSDIVWLDADGEVDVDEAEVLELEYQRSYEEPDGYTRVAYTDIWVNVQPFLTNVGAQAYIVANKHNLRNPRIYTDSARRNPEWKAIRAFLGTRYGKEWIE
jgi:hypothetical protein